ncbi:MAG: hypothetical protein H0W29_18550, partial [Gemmatimonadales bacterium]|nr:hypothetical protein [Gemmatimonadales bacterium]
RTLGLELADASGRGVSVRLTGRDLEDVTGVAFELSYDAEILEYAGASAGSYFGTAPVTGARVVERAPGRLVGVAAGMEQASGRSGSGELVRLNFRLLRLRDTQTTLGFATPQSLVYGPAGPTPQQTFINAQLVTRIRAPS